MKTFAMVFSLASILMSSSAVAETLVDTGTSPIAIFGWSVADQYFMASEFTLGSDAIVGSIEGFIGSVVDPQLINLKIYSDGGDVPGATLFSTSFTTTTGDRAQWQGAFGLHFDLPAGTYWVAFEGTNPVWDNGTFMPFLAPHPLTSDAVSYPTTGGYEAYHAVRGLEVGVRILSGEAATAVPEPATWAMMIAGFGMVGASLRRRGSSQDRLRVEAS